MSSNNMTHPLFNAFHNESLKGIHLINVEKVLGFQDRLPLLERIEKTVQPSKVGLTKAKRAFLIAMELIDNMLRHAPANSPSRVAIDYDEEHYFIRTVNLVGQNWKADAFINRMNKLSAMTGSEKKNVWRELHEHVYFQPQPAGLLRVSRLTDHPITYRINKLDNGGYEVSILVKF